MRITLSVHEFTESTKELYTKFPGDSTLSAQANAVLYALSCMSFRDDTKIGNIIDDILEAIKTSISPKAIVWDSDDPDQLKIYSMGDQSDLSPSRILN